jgi:apolipoprotein N-acyltransferase
VKIPGWLRDAGAALLTGALLGCVFPPADFKALVWVGLIPLWWVLRRGVSGRRALLLGWLAGFIFFLISLHPLASAHAWTGWAGDTQAGYEARLNRQWWFLHGSWMGLSVWVGCFWGLWGWSASRFSRRRWGVILATLPALWVIFPEWLRARAFFGFTWSFLGNAAADGAAVRQLASLGGVGLLGAFIVFVNVAVAELFARRGREWVRLLGVVLGVAGGVWGYGAWRLGHFPLDEGPALQGVVVQHHLPRYTLSDFTEEGMQRGYLEGIRRALEGGAELVVLPESVVFGAVSLDGSASQVKPADRVIRRERLDRLTYQLLQGKSAAVVMGLDTVEQGRDYNSLVGWTAEGPIGWYHKRRLVPFAEYRPRGWGGWTPQGESTYRPGSGPQLVRFGDRILGAFICQEVLFPEIIRESVRAGAGVLVTGGNDGVFAHPAVKSVHADAAQLRAVETGRFIARAMKTGISSFIDPLGEEQTVGAEESFALLSGTLRVRGEFTPYVRFGNWPLWVSGIVAIGGWLLGRHGLYFGKSKEGGAR